MAEKAATALTTNEALATIARTAAFEQPLRRRVEGVTWMVWGFATAGVLLTGNALELVYGFPGPEWTRYMEWLWLLAGIAATTAVWRIAALARPEVHPGRRAALGAIALVVGLIALIWIPASGFGLLSGQAQAALVPATLGVPWVALAIANPHRGTSVGRRVMVVIGVLMGLASVAWAPVAIALPHETGFSLTVLYAALTGGAIPFLAGFWQVLRG
ncbi:MAG TPA: hypothetical protein VGR28_11085 [Candidatus Thermoplasmatota archaeon]|jgi:hypothetical protein|nr:hypothetical protein [Candidatus Thermoplasmatota archaeon]